MEPISKNNVEAWLLDFQEGTLPDAQIAVLMEFLKSHPELELDPEFVDFPTLDPPRLAFPGVADLFKPGFYLADLSEDETDCVARLEGDLSESEAASFDAGIVAHPERAALYQLFQKTRIEPDFAIRFPHLGQLRKKRVLISPIIFPIASVAALLLIAFFIFSPKADPSGVAPLAGDTTRQVIFLNKLAHPSQYDRIAQREPVKKPYTTERRSPIVQEREKATLEQMGRLALNPIPLNVGAPESSFAMVSLKTLQVPADHYQTLLAFSGQMAREKILGQDSEMVKRTRFSFWELADAGLEKFSSTFSLPMDIDRQYNNQGDLVSVAFDSRLVAFSTPINGGRSKQNPEGL